METVPDKENAKVFCLDSLDAPVNSTIECTREFLTRPPDWRYQAAQRYLEEERDGETPTIPSDILIQYAIRALRPYVGPGGKSSSKAAQEKRLASRSRRASKHIRKYVMNLWPVMDEVLYLGIQARSSAMAAELDTCLIKGFDYATAKMAGCPVSREAYDLYAALFFDLSGVRAVHAWINDFLFEPEKHKENATLLRSRLIAYFGDSTSGLNAAVAGMLTDKEASIMRNVVANERQKKVFDYIMRTTKLDANTYVEIMEAAVKDMSEHDFQEHMRDRIESGSESMEALATHMEEGIRAFTQQELKEYDETGLDFVNQYTKSITESNGPVTGPACKPLTGLACKPLTGKTTNESPSKSS